MHARHPSSRSRLKQGRAMPVKFEWQTDQEHEWTEEQGVMPGGGTAVSLRKHWRIWLALMGMMVITGGVAYILLNQKADETNHLISNDVLASHQLIPQTVANRDVDVFATMLFPYSRDWASTQVQLFDRQLYWDGRRWACGLRLIWFRLSRQVTLAPDLQSAAVETQMPYIIEVSDTVTETVTLVETAVYAQNDGQWQLAPPDDDTFWGQTRTEEGRLFDVCLSRRGILTSASASSLTWTCCWPNFAVCRC